MGKLVLKSRHRLLCGDSTSAADVARLMGGEKADLCFTSPPYNAGDNRLGGNASMVDSKYLETDDDKEAGDYLAFMVAVTELVLAHCESAVINIQQLAGNKYVVIQWLYKFAGKFVDLAIWDKEVAPPQMARNVLNSQHELMVILSAKKEPSRAVPFADWHGTVPTVYRGPPQRDRAVSEVHAATFPLHLPGWVIGTLCPLAKTIYEPFSGSGTTIIACEQLKRSSYAMEITPAYVDLAVARFEQLTGEKAVLDG